MVYESSLAKTYEYLKSTSCLPVFLVDLSIKKCLFDPEMNGN